ncbi:hypothetical protein M2459_002440 [Parabacteroides sp. PF5-5]|uniref:hypothetical protein n=1 Tax=unclassified Parabacteroides TaxID=2649774 RepID=UPI0024752338|nr:MULTISPECIES: hypothetical protein [unclassified Parabacteroides]MDH6316693.1 hypothetical protein [Parabacteroides sp. PF5-13]MDH6327804.1 hypothetical protein [Parabacteroides sp. PH5-41]MDH6335680.1 hypothetical protein [Parabacteroides sp. PF5-5]MDH6346668.1 hypothetical protein [Parabacteroides sp. PH5-46]MDH6361706.1 hypothetical protein [Parabacteroides sp. PH5-16]
MKRLCYYVCAGAIAWLPLLANAQSHDLSYQVILESKGQYDDLDKGAFSATSRLYPIVTLKSDIGELSNSLQVEGSLVNYNFEKDSTGFSFQELYTRFSWKDRHHWAVGKKRLDWGSGMLWNPTNFYIQKDPFRTQNRLEGIFLLSYTYLFNTGSLELYVFPEKELEDFSYSLKYNYTGERVDLSLSFLSYRKHQQLGYDISYGGDLFIAYSEGVFRNYSKSYRVGEEGGLIAPENRSSKFYTEMVNGISVSFNAYLGARVECRFREDYLSRKEVNNYKKYMPLNGIIYDPISVGKCNLFASAEIKDLYDRFNFQLRSFFDVNSNQLIIAPLFVWKVNNFQVELSSMIFNKSLADFHTQTSILLSCHF